MSGIALYIPCRATAIGDAERAGDLQGRRDVLLVLEVGESLHRAFGHVFGLGDEQIRAPLLRHALHLDRVARVPDHRRPAAGTVDERATATSATVGPMTSR